MNRNNFCIILAGGIGVRLWPVSRQSEPKQFVDFLGSGESMLQTTYRRFRKIIDEDNIIVVSNIKYKSLVAKQLPNLKSKSASGADEKKHCGKCDMGHNLHKAKKPKCKHYCGAGRSAYYTRR